MENSKYFDVIKALKNADSYEQLYNVAIEAGYYHNGKHLLTHIEYETILEIIIDTVIDRILSESEVADAKRS